MYPLMERIISEHEAEFRAAPDTAAIFLPGGRPPRTGELFFQKEGAAALQFMADEEAAAARRGGRKAGLAATRDAFYKGDIARRIAEWQVSEGGWMTREDLASFRVGIEEPVCGRFGNADVYACGPWCQGPALIEVLNILGGYDLRKLGHNSADAVHVSVEAVKLAMADRDAWLGDPRFVDVPIDTLASEAYAALRRAEIDMGRAMPEMPPPGDAGSRSRIPAAPVPTREPGSCAAGHLLCLRRGRGGQCLLRHALRRLLWRHGGAGCRPRDLFARLPVLDRPGAMPRPSLPASARA